MIHIHVHSFYPLIHQTAHSFELQCPIHFSSSSCAPHGRPSYPPTFHLPSKCRWSARAAMHFVGELLVRRAHEHMQVKQSSSCARLKGILVNRCIIPLIPNLRTIWRWVAGFTHRPLCHQRKGHNNALNLRLAGSQSWSGRLEKTKISCPCQGLKHDPQLLNP